MAPLRSFFYECACDFVTGAERKLQEELDRTAVQKIAHSLKTGKYHFDPRTSACPDPLCTPAWGALGLRQGDDLPLVPQRRWEIRPEPPQKLESAGLIPSRIAARRMPRSRVRQKAPDVVSPRLLY